MIPLPEVYQLGLSARACNALRRAGINTIHDLDSLSYEELLSLRNVGVNTAYEIARKLQAWKNSHRQDPRR